MTAGNGYVDIQVNGYDGVDFNGDDLPADEVARVCGRLRDEGVAAILATVITADLDAMCRRLANIRRVRERDPLIAQTIPGIHIEGPFLNEQPGYIGAHPATAAREADADSMKRLLDAAGGLTRIVTLAPERDPGMSVTRMLADMDICVSAGHCNPGLDELKASVDAGLKMFTHLGNGMPLEVHRHDNIIQRALNLSDRLWIGLIADGVHLPFFVLENFIRCAGLDRAIIVTDAIEAAGRGPGTYRISDRTVIVDENLATWAHDKAHLVGSASTMPAMVQNLRTHLGLTENEIRRLTSENPRKAIGM